VVSPTRLGLDRRGQGIARHLTFDPLVPAGIGIAVIAWWLASLAFPPVRLPGPVLVAETALKDLFGQPVLLFLGLQGGGFLPHLLYTTTNVLVGVTLGTTIGAALGLSSARFWVVRDLVDPVLVVLGTVPILVAAPFLLMWFGVVPWAQILLVTFYTGSLVAIASQRAALNIPLTFEESAASLGADARRRFRTIVVPAAIPAILGGLRVALAASWGLEAIAELLGSPLGVGRVIVILQNVTDTAGMMAIILWLGIIAAAFDFIVERGVRWLIRWQD
jgi:ABC-type nitrate/sulfonate/bicarbonate transport system permease component